MKKFYLALIFVFSLYYQTNAQGRTFSVPIDISLFNNGNFMPGDGVLGVWSPKVHPGFTIGPRYYYNRTASYELFQTAKLGYFYHRHAQQGFQLYTELGYRNYFLCPMFFETRLNAGYMLSVPNIQTFEFKDGEYQEKKWKGRSQFIAGLNLSLGYGFYKVNDKLPFDVMLGYHFWVQTPFVNKYVPVLPNNSVHLGVVYYLPDKKN